MGDPGGPLSSPPATRAEVFGWSMYDFANSSYTTVIVTVYYAQLFPSVIVGDDRLGNLLWSVALSLSYGLTVITLPLLGALMDTAGRRKWFLAASTILTVAATAGLGLVGPGAVGLAMGLIVLSSYGFSVGESFIAAFLPDLGPASAWGRISGFAWGLGYIGGLGSTALVLGALGDPVPGNTAARWAGPMTAAWFAVAAIPTFLLLRDRAVPRPQPEGSSLVRTSLAQLQRTFREARRYRDLMMFLVSYLFAMAGLSIVVSFAFIYGRQVIQWSSGTQAAMFGITQISATVGALGFGWLQGRIGDKATYALTLLVWVVSVVLIRITPTLTDLGRALVSPSLEVETVFLGVGALAGLCIGATQSASRTLVALLSPPDKVGEFFGLWGVFGKLAAIVGLLSLGVLQAQLGLQSAILVTAVFFGIGFVVVLAVDVDRGRATAADPTRTSHR